MRTATTFGGAELVTTSAPLDSTLLRLRRRLPAGVFFAGWDAEDVLATDAVVGIHHPGGEVKKYSAGDVDRKADSQGIAGAIQVTWTEGATEGGSSGSALFRDGFVIGALSHGTTCDTGIYRDFYGPFAELYPRVCAVLHSSGGCGDGQHDLPSTARALAPGGTGMGAVDAAGDIDYWRVAIPSYGTLVVETTGDADTIGVLEDEQGQALATDDDGGTGRNFRLEQAVDRGTYYVRVTGTEDGMGDYALRIDHTPIAIDALPAVAWNDSTVEALAAPREVDRWQLDVEVAGSVALYTTGDVDTVGVLENAAGELLAGNDDRIEEIDLNFGIDVFLPAGTYLLKVSGYEKETGLYTLHANHTPLTDIPAVAEAGSTGEIDAPAKSDYWRFGVDSFGVSTLETSGSTDTLGRLYTGAGEPVATDDDGGEDRNFRIERILTAGTYYARIRAFEGEIGSYGVTASHVALAAADMLELDADGTSAAGSIGKAGEVDIWRFELPAATVATVATTGSLDTHGTLEDGFGRARTDGDSGPGGNFRITAALAAGTHYVRVRASEDDDTGDYALRVQSHADVGDTPATAAALAVDTRRDSVIGAAGDIDYWRLEVPSAGTIVVESKGATDTLGALEDAHGATLARNDDGGEARNFRIEREVFPGLYFVRVSGYGRATGDYALRVVHTRNTLAIPWFLAAQDAARGRQGFARLINRSQQRGVVEVRAIDDAGTTAGSFVLALQAGETVHFNSNDLEDGNPAKGIAAGVGAGVGDWRLELATALDLNVLAYVRTAQGFLTTMHDLVPRRPTEGTSNSRYVVPIFNPASNRRQVSKLRLFNLGDERAAVTITGLDDNGEPSPGSVRLSLAPAAARTLSAAELESGGDGIEGSLGDGRGKWELAVGSTEPLGVMNLLESPPTDADTTDGNLTNLSTASAVPSVAPGAQSCTPCEVPLFIAADDPLRQGFVRLSNHSAESGSVEIHAIDDAGRRFGPATIAMNAGATVHFNSDDLEAGQCRQGPSSRRRRRFRRLAPGGANRLGSRRAAGVRTHQRRLSDELARSGAPRRRCALPPSADVQSRQQPQPAQPTADRQPHAAHRGRHHRRHRRSRPAGAAGRGFVHLAGRPRTHSRCRAVGDRARRPDRPIGRRRRQVATAGPRRSALASAQPAGERERKSHQSVFVAEPLGRHQQALADGEAQAIAAQRDILYVEDAAVAEHQAGRGQVAAQQVGAESAFRRHQALADHMHRGEPGAAEDAGLAHLTADDDVDAAFLRRSRNGKSAHETAHLGDAQIDDPAPRIVKGVELLLSEQALVQDDLHAARLADVAEPGEIAHLQRFFNGEAARRQGFEMSNARLDCTPQIVGVQAQPRVVALGKHCELAPVAFGVPRELHLEISKTAPPIAPKLRSKQHQRGVAQHRAVAKSTRERGQVQNCFEVPPFRLADEVQKGDLECAERGRVAIDQPPMRRAPGFEARRIGDVGGEVGGLFAHESQTAGRRFAADVAARTTLPVAYRALRRAGRDDEVLGVATARLGVAEDCLERHRKAERRELFDAHRVSPQALWRRSRRHTRRRIGGAGT